MSGQFRILKEAVLGRRYFLSVAFISSQESRRLNRRYRKKDCPTDILSFSIDASHGEILFCRSEVKKQARLFRRAPDNFLLFLLIHGLLHLKGMRHGSKMECEESKLRKRFGV